MEQGSARWRSQPLKTDDNLEVAFGMADAASLQERCFNALEEAWRAPNRSRAAVRQWRASERTEQVLGIAPGAPARALANPDHSEHAFSMAAATAWSSGQ